MARADICERLRALCPAGPVPANTLCVVTDDPQLEREWLNTDTNVVQPVWFELHDGEESAAVRLTLRLAQLSRLLSSTATARDLMVTRVALAAAHDIDNLVTIVGGNTALLADDFPPGTEQREMLEEAIVACERARHFTRTLQVVAPESDHAPLEVVDVAEAVRAAAAFARELLPPAIELIVRVEGAGLHVRAPRGAFATALWNLIANARDASPRGGKIEVYAEGADSGGNDWVLCGCRDDGPGLHESAVWADVVNAYVSVDRPGHRLGLGLAQVCALTRNLGGFVRNHASSEGLDVQLVLPMAGDA